MVRMTLMNWMSTLLAAIDSVEEASIGSFLIDLDQVLKKDIEFDLKKRKNPATEKTSFEQS
jgi:hypothetical protein